MSAFYRRVNTHKEYQDLLGFLMIIGGMFYILGILLLDTQLMIVGSGCIIMSSSLAVCCLENNRHRLIYEGTDQVEEDADE